jgi:chromate reductase, NAD(P)H dehydrogenase (quinone)
VVVWRRHPAPSAEQRREEASVPEPINVLGFAGSLRQGSFNRAALRAAVELAPEGMTIETFDLAPIQPYNEDVKQRGFPPPEQELRERIRAADAVLIVTPEYNRSIPGVLKNAIDWVSRPTDGEGLVALSGFRGKVAGLMAASISPFGGLRGITHMRQILSTIQTMVATEQVLIPFAQNAFDESGALKEPLPAQLLGGLVARVIDLTERLEPPVA